jgi:hypothetical protein
MKVIRIAGSCLVTMIAMNIGMVGTASAALTWKTCGEGASGTKYETNQCEKISGTGKFGWEEIKGTEGAVAPATLMLADTKVPVVGTVEVTCSGEGLGSAGPGKFSRIDKIENITCSPGKNCESVKETAKPLHLPWQGELEEVGTEKRNNLTGTGGGPGWAVTCKVLGFEKTDECTIEKGAFTVGFPVKTVTNNHFLLLALLDFTAQSPNANCTVGGAETGRIRGSTGYSMSVVTAGGLTVSTS